MPTMVEVSCEECGTTRYKPLGEVNRSIKKGRRFFCGTKCSAKHGNRAKKGKEIVLPCPWCKTRFKTKTNKKAKKHCSASCASKASMTPERREAQRAAGDRHKANLSVAAAMKSREAWKYDLLKHRLENEDYEFECEIGGYIFDLVLHGRKIAVEFDGPHPPLRQERSGG